MRLTNRAAQSSRLEKRQLTRVDPRIVVASTILELPLHELDKRVEQELADNPALERVEKGDNEPPRPVGSLNFRREISRQPGYDVDDPAAEESPDWQDYIASPVSLRDHLLAQLAVMLPKDELPLASLVVDCVGTTGYLELSEEEIALLADEDLDHVKNVVRTLHRCEPPGVGARNLRECLALQLRNQQDDIDRLALRIVKRHWDDLVAKRTRAVSRAYGVMPQVVERAFARIAALTPYPGEAFATDSLHRNYGLASVTPDIAYRRTEAGILLEVRSLDPHEFCVNEWYKQKYDLARSNSKALSSEEKAHVTEFVERATRFIYALKQRQLTLLRIGRELLNAQAGFINTGSYAFLVPFTRLQLAKAARLHESTVSRATMGKFVQIANGETVSFDVFFKPQLRIQKMIEEILGTEDPRSPLSDREICELLAKKGITVARRTVNKYREQARLLSSRRRRTA